MDFRKISNISVNCVVFGWSTDGIKVLLSKRVLCLHDENYPDIDDWMIPGEHVFKSERLDQSAERIFTKFTGVDTAYYKQFRTFGNPKRIKNYKDLLWMKCRDSNPRTASVAYYFLLPIERVDNVSEKNAWFPLSALPTLAFDHNEIIKRANDDLMKKILLEPLVFDLLPTKFTINELQCAYAAVLNIEIDNRNFRKKALAKQYIVQLDEKRKGESKKPSSLYMFSRDVYNSVADSKTVGMI